MIAFQGKCPSPKCSSSDAYTEYTDGGWHCFSCGYHSGGNKYKSMLSKIYPIEKEEDIKKCPPLPNDSIPILDLHESYSARGWLLKYGLSDRELEENRLLWSREKSLLIFPIYGNSLVMWQGRYFGGNYKHPKYITRGEPEKVLHLIGEGNTLVLVEDLISAIKVGRHTMATPLFGSNISPSRAAQITFTGRKSVLWLDNDKQKESIKFASQYNMGIILSQHDPKCYDDNEIRSYLKLNN